MKRQSQPRPADSHASFLLNEKQWGWGLLLDGGSSLVQRPPPKTMATMAAAAPAAAGSTVASPSSTTRVAARRVPPPRSLLLLLFPMAFSLFVGSPPKVEYCRCFIYTQRALHPANGADRPWITSSAVIVGDVVYYTCCCFGSWLLGLSTILLQS